MRILITILLSMVLLYGYSQPKAFVRQQTSGDNITLTRSLGGNRPDSAAILAPTIYADTTAANSSVVSLYSGTLIQVTGAQIWYRTLVPPRWWRVGTMDSITGKVNYSDSNVIYLTPYQASQTYVPIQTQSPTASLSGGYSYERHAAGTFSVTLNWGAGRQATTSTQGATNPFKAYPLGIVVAGVAQPYSQPLPGATVTGTQSVTVTYNSNTTYTNTVTTTDSKTASASTSFGAYDKRYLGWSATNTPTSVEILAAVYQDNSGGNPSMAPPALAQLGSAKYLFIINTAAITSVNINGSPSTAAFSLNNSISFTNSNGGTFSGYYTVSNTPGGNSGTTTVITN